MKMISEGSPLYLGFRALCGELAWHIAAGSSPTPIDYTEPAAVTRNGSLAAASLTPSYNMTAPSAFTCLDYWTHVDPSSVEPCQGLDSALDLSNIQGLQVFGC
jgi:hypothetical protein